MATLTIPRWRQIQRQNIFCIKQLLNYLQITHTGLCHDSKFPINIPLRIAQKMPKGTLNDPLIRQFIPLLEENDIAPGFTNDPVGDQGCRRSPKLLHKYQGRVLLVTSSACAMHCRYCFRKEFPYETEIKDFSNEIAMIARDDSISEVILSGGDPLSLSDRRLKSLFESLNSIPHIRRIRIHSRLPIGIPERITDELLDIFSASPKQLYFVTHINHPRELDQDIFDAFKDIQSRGVTVLNQAVLLQGINNDFKTLHQLFETLCDHGILPYYLHQLDRVQGTAHYEVSIEDGKQLMQQLRDSLPGYAVPNYVQDLPGLASKQLII